MWLLTLLKPNFIGLLGGTIFYCFSLTPSLLPRPPIYAGVIAGISFAVGYALGVVLSWAYRRTIRKEPAAHIKRLCWWIAPAFMAASMLAYSIWNVHWENEVRRLIGQTDFEGQHVIFIFCIAALVAGVVISVGRLIAAAMRAVGDYVNRWVPQRIAVASGIVIVAGVMVFLYNGVIVKIFVDTSNSIYSKQNKTTPPGIKQPTIVERSGSPSSLVSWKTLGYQGKAFVSRGPTKQQIAAFSGRPAKEPIRAYAGLDSAGSAKARADLAVRELKRTGAFNRSVLVVAGSTGTGWISPQAADSLEYMWNGDTAIVTTQYSYLPSWISFLVDQQKAQDAGRELFNAVYDTWKTLPADHRPKLIAYGLSLGSFSMQSGFSGSDDLQNRTDGALFVGTPHFSEPWGQFTANRDAGSPEWQPTYQKGNVVRFVANQEDISALSAWNAPRVLYVQHASDSIVWWDFNLLWHKPAWLKEHRGPDVSKDMQWYPFVTFAQVSVDQFFGTKVPQGHGHNYETTMPAAWSAVIEPPDWSESQLQKLNKIIALYPMD